MIRIAVPFHLWGRENGAKTWKSVLYNLAQMFCPRLYKIWWNETTSWTARNVPKTGLNFFSFLGMYKLCPNFWVMLNWKFWIVLFYQKTYLKKFNFFKTLPSFLDHTSVIWSVFRHLGALYKKNENSLLCSK